MFNYSVLVFVSGWVLWFVIDKHAFLPGVLPPPGDSMQLNFQLAFDLLKSGYIKAAFVFIWQAHFLVLSVIGGVLLTAAMNMLSGRIRRYFLHRHMLSEKFRHKPCQAETDTRIDKSQQDSQHAG